MFDKLLKKLGFNFCQGSTECVEALSPPPPPKGPTEEEEKLSAQIRDKMLKIFEKYPPHEWTEYKEEDRHNFMFAQTYRHESSKIKLQWILDTLSPIGAEAGILREDSVILYEFFKREREKHKISEGIKSAKKFLEL